MKIVELITAEWCNSCHVMEQIIGTMEQEGVIFQCVDIEDCLVNPPNSVPTIRLYNEDGEIVQEVHGAMTKHQLEKLIKECFYGEEYESLEI